MVRKILISRLFILLAILLLSAASSLQASGKADTLKVAMIGRAQEKAILLRWGINDPSAWKAGNQYGYRLERYTVIRNKQLLAQPEKKILAQEPLQPRPLAAWEELAKADNNAAIIAQALYGKDFELSSSGNMGIASIVSQSQELDQRFAFAMYAADQSFEAAKMAGLAWSDTTAKKGEKYLYRIISLVPPNVYKIDSASVFTGLNDYQPLPVPQDIAAVFGDKSVMLSWNYTLLKNYYTAYYIERSSDGKNFSRLSGLPVTNLNNKPDKQSERIFYIDSLPDNQTVWHYRIAGISSFGEPGPPSEAVKGKGRRVLMFVPNIKRSSVNKGVLKLEWEFEDAGNAQLKRFLVSRAASAAGPYVTVKQDLTPESREVELTDYLTSNYFTVTAIPVEGEPRISQPYFVQPVDSVPPLAPLEFRGVVDTNGVVKLYWKPNAEKDLLGYRIYRANSKGETMIAVADSVFQTASFNDSVNVSNLNQVVYYAVTAFDQRYNQSDFSAVLALKKPDKIPPSAPLITSHEIKDGQVNISFETGTETDIVSYLLFRQEKFAPDSVWKIVAEQNKKNIPGQIIDAGAENGKRYRYRLVAKDQTGLTSPFSSVLSVGMPPVNSTRESKAFNAYVDKTRKYIELSWNKNTEGVSAVEIYKADSGAPLALWKVVRFADNRITDEDLKISTEYMYGFRLIYDDGRQGKFMVVKVNY